MGMMSIPRVVAVLATLMVCAPAEAQQRQARNAGARRLAAGKARAKRAPQPRKPRRLRLLTPDGPTKFLETANGSAEVIESGSTFYTVAQDENGDLSYGNIALSTPFGQSAVVRRGKRLRHEIEIGRERYLVAERDDGEVIYKNSKGESSIGSPRSPTGRRLTEYGPVKDLETATGVVEGVDQVFQQVVELESGGYELKDIRAYTPFGYSEVVPVRGGRLRHQIVVFGERFLVGENESGQVVYKNTKGDLFVGTPKNRNGRILTPRGPARDMDTALGVVEVVGEGTDVERLTVSEDGDVEYAGGAQISTPYGYSQVVERGKRLSNEITISGRRFVVGQDDSGVIFYRNSKGKVFRGAPRI